MCETGLSWGELAGASYIHIYLMGGEVDNNNNNNNNGGVVEETTSSSPVSRVKFMCSHGGRIIPRPTDGQLKYVGGETRVISVPRDISFSELMKKLTATIDRDMVLKYQVIPEELDALVSVRSDEDLKHMVDEHDRHESEGNPKLRAFLFPSNPIILENQATSIEPHVLEQRYIDAINGIFRTTPHPKLTSINTNKTTFSISSGCSSPHSNSPDGQNVDATMTHESNLSNVNQNGTISVHRVQSSPTLYCLNNFQNLSNNPGNHHLYQHHQHYHLNYQHHLHHGYHPRPMDSHRGDVGREMLTRNWSLGRVDGGRSLMGRGLNPHYTSSCHHRESGGCINWGYHEEHGVLACTRLSRSGSLSRSPISPRNAFLESEKA